MAVLYNDYIFLPKTKKEDSHISSKDNDDTICIQARKKVPLYIKNIFGEPISKDIENIMLKIIYTYEIEIKNIMYEVIFTIYNITHYSYLNIRVSGKTTNQVISALEYVQDRIVGSDIERDYVMITSYDSVSEYYCNKAYPKLNKLERNLRKLLFNTYTINFGEEYVQKTVSPDLQKKIKGVIQAKGNEEKKRIERLKKFFYSMEFSDIQSLLFTKKWTKIEEESEAEFLSKHENLTELSDEDLRNAFYTFSPKSDWERLFADKIDNSEIENMIETIRSNRNDIAHCKFFYKEQYNAFNKAATDLNHLIIKAIQLTEEKDFANKQGEAFSTVLTKIVDTWAQYQKNVIDNIISTIQPCLSVMNEVEKSINIKIDKILSNIDFDRLAAIIENVLNDEESSV